MSDLQLGYQNRVFINSQVLHHRTRFDWKIENFSQRPKCIKSVEINPGPGCRTKWTFMITDDDPSPIPLQEPSQKLRMVNINFKWTSDVKMEDNLTGHISIYLFNSKGQILRGKDLHLSAKENAGQSGSFLDIATQNAGENDFKLLDDILIIQGSIWLQGCCFKSTALKPLNPVTLTEGIASTDVELTNLVRTTVLRGSENGVVVLIAEDVAVPVHAFVLFSNSLLLRQAIEKKGKDAHLSLPNISKRALVALVSFMYTTKVAEDAGIPLLKELLECSDRYGMPPLKEICLQKLGKKDDSSCQIM